MIEPRNEGPLGEPPTQPEHRSPVLATGEVEIAAVPDVVWGVLTDFAHWPDWNPEVKSMQTTGPASVGATFRWRAGPGTITSTIQRLEPTRRITWTGKSLGIRAVNSWHLEPREGNTIVWEDESFNGLVARLFRSRLQRSLNQSLQDGLQHLKAEAERRSHRPSDLESEGVTS